MNLAKLIAFWTSLLQMTEVSGIHISDTLGGRCGLPGRNSSRQIPVLCSTFKRTALIQWVSVIYGSEKAGDHWINQSLEGLGSSCKHPVHYLLQQQRVWLLVFTYWRLTDHIYYFSEVAFIGKCCTMYTRGQYFEENWMYCHLRTKTMFVRMRWYHGNMFIGFCPLSG
jgi:hypothetical protein